MAKLINGVSFDISQPYAEGHSISAIEAKVLNQTRAENIGNNVRAKLKEMQEAGASEAELSQYVSQIDAEYAFSFREGGGARVTDPVEREAIKIAKELLKQNLAETGRKLTVAPEGVTQEEWEAKIAAEIERVSQLDPVVKAAKQRVDQRRKQADSLMGALEGATL